MNSWEELGILGLEMRRLIGDMGQNCFERQIRNNIFTLQISSFWLDLEKRSH